MVRDDVSCLLKTKLRSSNYDVALIQTEVCYLVLDRPNLSHPKNNEYPEISSDDQAPMVADPPNANCTTTDTDTHLISEIGDTLSTLAIWLYCQIEEDHLQQITTVFVEQSLAKPVGLLTVSYEIWFRELVYI